MFGFDYRGFNANKKARVTLIRLEVKYSEYSTGKKCKEFLREREDVGGIWNMVC